MKKIIYILLTVFIAFSCKDFNEDNFDWYEDSQKVPYIANYQYTITDADIKTIADALKATGTEENKAKAAKLEASKTFSPELKPAELIPYLLAKKYYTADVKSSALITYMYDDARDEILSGLTGVGPTLTMDDYKLAWGNELFTNSFNPEQTPEANLPKILKTLFPETIAGTYKTVEYNYSDEDKVTSIVEGDNIMTEDFESMGLEANDPITIEGWNNKDVTGTKVWQVKVYSGNTYAQMSANGSKEVNNVWLTTKKIDLKNATNPHLKFDVKIGYYNADCLQIKVSDNFDGNPANISKATWTDITNKFTIPQEPTNGYGADFVTSGLGSLETYKGKEVYIAFLYNGDDTSTPKKTTTYQIDNVVVCEAVVGIDVPNKAPRYASYVSSEDQDNEVIWKPVGTDILTLQPDDYTNKIGISSGLLTTAQAHSLLPQYLGQNVIGTEKVIVYRTKAGEYYADRFKYGNSVWTVETTLGEQTSQFIRAESGWLFDPTIIIPMTKPDYRMIVDYVKDNLMDGNEAVWDDRGNAEYYFGFSEYFGNITYREANYRDKDNTYPITASQEEKIQFMNQRTKEGLAILLTLKYPDATPQVSGVDQFARFDDVTIYSEPNASKQNVIWSYTFQCIGDKQWEFVSREGDDGRSEVAPKK